MQNGCVFFRFFYISLVQDGAPPPSYKLGPTTPLLSGSAIYRDRLHNGKHRPTPSPGGEASGPQKGPKPGFQGRSV